MSCTGLVGAGAGKEGGRRSEEESEAKITVGFLERNWKRERQ